MRSKRGVRNRVDEGANRSGILRLREHTKSKRFCQKKLINRYCTRLTETSLQHKVSIPREDPNIIYEVSSRALTLAVLISSISY